MHFTIDNLFGGCYRCDRNGGENAPAVLNWTNPADTSTAFILVLRDTTAVVTPVGGAGSYAGTRASTIGMYNFFFPTPSAAANCADTGVTNGNTYHYKIFTRDKHRGNYFSTGVVPTGSPTLPSGPGCYAKAGGGGYGKRLDVGGGRCRRYRNLPRDGVGVQGVLDSGKFPVYITLTTAVTGDNRREIPAEAASVTFTAPSSRATSIRY